MAAAGSHGPTALIADDEPLLREQLCSTLATLWPALQVVAQARNGREAIELFDTHLPDICFLDIRMPGVNGIEAARAIGGRAALVFVTAHEEYAVRAFEQGAIDYLVKPFEPERLADTIGRLQLRLTSPPLPPARDALLDGMLSELSQRLRTLPGPDPLRRHWLQWIKASVGHNLRLIPVDEVHYLRSDEKYTLVAWEGGEALIRRPIRELADELDPERFVQIHRSTIVNLRQVAQVIRGPNETADVQLKSRPELLAVSRSYLHVFRQM
jgi:DNA-binding LytR/AlgR family response regulator